MAHFKGCSYPYMKANVFVWLIFVWLKEWYVGWRAGVADKRRVRAIKKALKVLKEAMVCDPNYAYTWQCNIALPVWDAAGSKLNLAEANKIADALMAHLFEVKPVVGRGGRGASVPETKAKVVPK